ncbi:two-component regulator propeller domain-containing protein [Alkalitalea saponilacus]|uniref:Serine phosphatase RsbU, regulator of sigma subunit n=1 Tax=Alkalitalea saponilacus TaxID=889453 RepID=A0A1T5AH03_9BACT|nr:two-component regulator propeller domain-containing protein [Alkalitalea saponilacus]ASB48703.1 serine/threonine protein kinase [Alkalitalea saponilacus]SKB34258.1 Serine phosphatase RsbU, regulator of sigma subunit [Alkalitalea saponilacus]
MKFEKKICCLICFGVLVFSYLEAQTFQFRNYDSNMGLPQNFVYALEQGHDGFLWIGTGEGLVKYDGLRFRSFTTADSLAGDFVMSLKVARDGKLWVGHNNGDVSVFHNNRFTPIVLEETTSPVRDITEDRDGHIWVVVQNSGFARIDRYNNVTTWFDTGNLGFTLFYSIHPLGNNQVLLGTSEGLMKLTLSGDGKIESLERYSEIPMTTITSITPRKGIQDQFWITTEDEGFYSFALKEGQASHIIDNSLCLTFNLEWENIQAIEEEEEGHLLLATWGNGVIKLFFDPVSQEFTESFTFSTVNGMNNNFIRDILADYEGNYWFATYGGGVASLVDESMVFYDLDEIGFQNNKVISVFQQNNELWIGMENGLIIADPFCFTDFEFYDDELGIPRDNVTAFYRDDEGTMWVATGGSGLYYRRDGEFQFSRYHFTRSRMGNMINDITGSNGVLHLATIGGYYQLDIESGSSQHLTTENGLPHNNVNFVFLDRDGFLWMGLRNSGVSRIVNNSIEIHRITDTPLDVFDMTQDHDGNIWLATQGRGVLQYSEDSLRFIDMTSGLARNFCYNVVIDTSNRLWVTHFPGLSSIDLNSGEIRRFDYEQNLGADFYHAMVDENQTIWFGSTQGAINYFPDKDVINKMPPMLNFTSVRVSGREFGTVRELNLPYAYGDRYRFRFDFIGISFKDPLGVRYQYRLLRRGESSTPEWVDLGNTSFREYEYLPDGSYTLQIRAFNADGVYNEEPLTIQIVIASPFWKKGWFYLVLISVLSYVVYLIIVFRERKLRKQKEALQREVDSQTVILRLQKAEIERKNRDITDSINYAKRIQSSILPPPEVIENQFRESFIFFAPRDIVSGDFYWFHPLNGKFLICAADCTGHGVPGAFMSMIGTTLLNDIVKRKEIKSPADILSRLDIEIKILLQKNDKDNTRDGMDISIVEVDPKNGTIRLASAKRPVYIFINGELNIYKGIRRSIGDLMMEDDSEFVDIEYQTKEGDTFYMFSDGFTDQFGGPKGKKYMTSRAKDLLVEIEDKPMREQLDIIRNEFFNWKGDEEQVDDVVFVGVRL